MGEDVGFYRKHKGTGRYDITISTCPVETRSCKEVDISGIDECRLCPALEILISSFVSYYM